MKDTGVIPRELVALPQWVVWKLEADPKGKPNKVPYNAQTGRKASTSNPVTWSTFDQVGRAFKSGQYTGVGFVLSATDRLTGIDLDKVRNRETGDIEPWAQNMIDQLASYTEISPSGTGIHVFVFAELPPGRRRIERVEMYNQGRFFTVTGEHLDGTPAAIEERTDVLAKLHEAHLATPKPSNHSAGLARSANPRSVVDVDLVIDDAELIDRAKRAKDGRKFAALMDGDTSAYGGDDSRADLALCCLLAFWTDNDRARIDRIFRLSRLHREKWDSKRGTSTYGEMTIDRAIENTTKTYQPRQRSASTTSTNGHRPALGSDLVEASKSNGRVPAGHFPLTELGNAERLVARHGSGLRYCATWGKWLAWNGQRWEIDQTGEIERRAKTTVRGILHEAADVSLTKDAAEKVAKHAFTSESRRAIAAMVGLTASEPGIAIRPDDLDHDGWLLNVPNGTIDLRTAKLRPHRAGDLITKTTRAPYDPAATSPVWDRFLEEILPDAELREFVQRAVGYSLTTDVREQVLFFLYGSGSNGKSTFLNAILETLGDYARQAPPELLVVKRGDAHPTEIADLAGVRFLPTVEIEDGRRLAEALVKQLTGGDPLKARRMREDFWTFLPTHKIWLAANHKPIIRGTDYAIWRRIRLVPYEATFKDDAASRKPDKLLPIKLREELPGILRWAVEGCLAWQRDGLGLPEKVRIATEGYRAEMDVIADFLEDRCVVQDGARVRSSDLYAEYQRWCEATGEHLLTKKKFGMRLDDRGFRAGHDAAGVRRLRFGLGLANQPQQSSLTDSSNSSDAFSRSDAFISNSGMNSHAATHERVMPKVASDASETKMRQKTIENDVAPSTPPDPSNLVADNLVDDDSEEF